MGNNNQGMDHARVHSYPEIHTLVPLPFFDSLNAEEKDEALGQLANRLVLRVARKKWRKAQGGGV